MGGCSAVVVVVFCFDDDADYYDADDYDYDYGADDDADDGPEHDDDAVVDRGVSAEDPAQEIAVQSPSGGVRHQRHGSDERFRAEPDDQVQDGEKAHNKFNPTHVLAAVYRYTRSPVYGMMCLYRVSRMPSVWYYMWFQCFPVSPMDGMTCISRVLPYDVRFRCSRG